MLRKIVPLPRNFFHWLTFLASGLAPWGFAIRLIQS